MTTGLVLACLLGPVAVLVALELIDRSHRRR
jgi:hypothetical protein